MSQPFGDDMQAPRYTSYGSRGSPSTLPQLPWPPSADGSEKSQPYGQERVVNRCIAVRVKLFEHPPTVPALLRYGVLWRMPMRCASHIVRLCNWLESVLARQVERRYIDYTHSVIEISNLISVSDLHCVLFLIPCSGSLQKHITVYIIICTPYNITYCL